MKVYVESSVVLRRILRQPGAIEDWSRWDWVVTSELTRIEARRTLDRLRVRGILSGTDVADMVSFLRAYMSRFEEIRVKPAVLERAASALPTELKTMDAIHLATALLWIEEKGESLTLVTHDRQLAIAARATGLDVEPAF
ncbi:MAG: type II toxin-antitoxin system VapC family toxin [Acidobacteria bacterium]|nr:type II toxin-antitoxin system VapC family toxin [Acidobacteriota bacterium]